MDTQRLVEILTREVLKEIAKREKEILSDRTGIINSTDNADNKKNLKNISENTVVTAFLGNDEVLKDELKKNMPILDNIKLGSSWEEIAQGKNENRLIVSNLCINALIELSQGKKSIITEYLFNDGEVILVEEGLEYKKYSEPAALIRLYDEYLEKVKKFGIKVIKRTEVKDMLDIREKIYIEGLITESKLRNLGIKNQILAVGSKSKITSLAMDYIKENNINVYYERGQ